MTKPITRRGFLKLLGLGAVAASPIGLVIRKVSRRLRRVPQIVGVGRGSWKLIDNTGLSIRLPDPKVIAEAERRCRLMLVENIGIIVNREEAYDNFARSLDLEGGSQLTKEQRNVAILNAVIESGRKYL